MLRILIQLFSASKIEPSGLPTNTPTNGAEIQTILQIVFGIVGALAFLMIVISGLRYVLSAGNPDRTSRAKDGIIYALIGMLIAITAEALVSFVLNRI